MTDQISVVIPAYNAETTITRTIESVLGQTTPAAEIIIVDDGSIDNTISQLQAYSEKVKLVKQENLGSAAARQTGSAIAISEYIAYLDADDYWPPNKLENLKAIINEYQPDFLLADLDRAISTKEETNYLPRNSTFYPKSLAQIKRNSSTSEHKNLYILEQPQALKLLLDGYPVYPSTMLISKNLLSHIGGWNPQFKRCQDYDLGLRALQKTKLYYLHEVMATLGIHEVNGNENTYVEMQTKGDIEVLKSHIETTSSNHYKQQCKAALAKKWMNLADTQMKLGKKKEAITSQKQAFLLPGKKISTSYHLLKTLFTF